MAKRFVIRKYIMAETIVEAIQKEKEHPVQDAWIDEKQPEAASEKPSLIGFETSSSEYFYSPILDKKKKNEEKKRNNKRRLSKRRS